MKTSDALPIQCAAIIAEMKALGRPEVAQGMARFGVIAPTALGLTTPQLRALARGLGRNQALAEELWKTGIHDARILASFVADPKVITVATMDQWVRDFATWDVCDACAYGVFDASPHAWPMLTEWAQSDGEFVRRAAFSLIAGRAVHDKRASDRIFLDTLPLIERYAFDDRNFVKKAVNWALRGIGKRNPVLLKDAIGCAERIQLQGTRAARWIASDALRELRGRLP